MKSFFEATGAVIGAVIICVAIALLFGGLFFAISWFTAGPSGKLNARRHILSGDNLIVQKETFYNICQSVQVAEKGIQSQTQELNALKADLADERKAGEDTSDTRDDIHTVLTNISANQIARTDAVTQYNVNAKKSFNEAKFRARNLPFQLPLTIPQGGTQCAI